MKGCLCRARAPDAGFSIDHVPPGLSRARAALRAARQTRVAPTMSRVPRVFACDHSVRAQMDVIEGLRPRVVPVEDITADVSRAPAVQRRRLQHAHLRFIHLLSLSDSDEDSCTVEQQTMSTSWICRSFSCSFSHIFEKMLIKLPICLYNATAHWPSEISTNRSWNRCT